MLSASRRNLGENSLLFVGRSISKRKVPERVLGCCLEVGWHGWLVRDVVVKRNGQRKVDGLWGNCQWKGGKLMVTQEGRHGTVRSRCRRRCRNNGRERWGTKRARKVQGPVHFL